MINSRIGPVRVLTTTAIVGTRLLDASYDRSTLDTTIGPWKVVKRDYPRPPHAVDLDQFLLPARSLINSNSVQLRTAHTLDKRSDRDGNQWYVKYIQCDANNEPTDEGIMAALTEAYFYEVCRVIAPEYVPDVKVAYNNSGKITAILTKAIPFKPNKKAPLTTDHFPIECLEIKSFSAGLTTQFNAQLTKLRQQIEALKQKEEARIKAKQSSYWFGVGYLVNTLNANVSRDPVAEQAKIKFETVLKKIDDIKNPLASKESIAALQTALQELYEFCDKREDHLTAKTATHHIEVKPDYAALATQAKSIGDIAANPDVTYVTIPELKQFLAQVKATHKAKNSELDLSTATDEFTEIIHGRTITITAKELRNYAAQKGVAYSLVMRAFVGDVDTHEYNLDIFGWVLDFDMSAYDVTDIIKNKNALDRLASIPKWLLGKPMKLSVDFIRNFPNVPDIEGYWPAKQFFLQEPLRVVVDAAKAIVNTFITTTNPNPDASYTQNWFPTEHVLPYQQINQYKVFDFHKYEAFFSIILKASLFRKQADIFMAETQRYHYKNDTLFNGIIIFIENRAAELRESLVQMPEFAAFLNAHGKQALEQFKNDLRINGEKRPQLKPTLDALNKNLDELFEEIQTQVDQCKSQNEKSNPVLSTHSVTTTGTRINQIL